MASTQQQYKCPPKGSRYYPKEMRYNDETERFMDYVVVTQSIKEAETQENKKREVEAEKTREKFTNLANEWKEATSHFSLSRQQIGHRSFLKIIAMGDKAVPFILEDLRHCPMEGWLTALEVITDENAASKATSYREAVKCWIDWGMDKGYLKF
jgi:hypothetical protein